MGNQSVRPSSEQQKTEILRKLVTVVVDSDTPSQDRQSAKNSLQRVGNYTIVGTLGEVIEESKDSTVIADATEVLSRLPATANVRTSLMMLLWNDSPTVRRCAMQALSRVGDEEVAAVLAVIISESQDIATIFNATDGDLAQETREAILRRAPQ
jgi:HEAT repeat protein